MLWGGSAPGRAGEHLSEITGDLLTQSGQFPYELSFSLLFVPHPLPPKLGG